MISAASPVTVSGGAGSLLRLMQEDPDREEL
jgi:hypothetical protein